MLQRKIMDMKQEEIAKLQKMTAAAKGAFVNPIQGTQLAIDKAHVHCNPTTGKNVHMIVTVDLIIAFCCRFALWSG
ncbi:MAG: hypothetical protein K2H89_11135 [Oscillospiraceae bacterium]|nr:hypothetical protein [Oscillospiraceae bacterium]